MHIGNKILELRKQKNVTQEDLAAELGVTAAAISKWENGYTLPDIMMLCALADYFAVTTDALLGRHTANKQAIVVAQTDALGQKICDLLRTYRIETAVILTDYEAALAVAQFEEEHNKGIQYMITAIDRPLEEREMDDTHGLTHVNVHVSGGNDEDILNGIELYFKNLDAFKGIQHLSCHK